MTLDFPHKKACFVAAIAILASICVTSDFVSKEYSLMIFVNRLNSRLYKLVIDAIGSSENLIMSSFSLHSALSMLTLGAAGETEREMLKALGFPWMFNLIESHQAATKQINSIRGVTINTANRIYVNEGLKLNSTFSRTAFEVFSAGAKHVKFSDNIAAAKTINAWVEYKTNKKITDLLSPDMLDASTALVLVNALYFKGFWDKPFNPKNTLTEKFTTLEGNKVDVEMMHQKNSFAYGLFDNEKIQVLEMFYKFENVSMVIILPKDANAFKEFEKNENINFERVYPGELNVHEVSVGLPKFKIETLLNLNKYLFELGFQKMFSGGDLSGLITGSLPLSVGHVVQKAFVEVNELGTEAAAATAVVVERASSRETFFVCDRPFLFYIVEKPHGKILFSGRKVA